MSITSRDLKLLWSRAAGRCSICRIVLTHDSLNGDESYSVGEQAHIVAESEDGPRGESILSREERGSYFNLILLCPSHHREIDANEADYPVERLMFLNRLTKCGYLRRFRIPEAIANTRKLYLIG
jgi:hypothetical protein